ncbi:hypothetical protein GCM10025865_26000 [Paraoerskovia sediminicola]|uniref:Integral membrane protein n=1 Tax=Paraoerskovia sediminicola TaxID=1138587 RepID=A0ABM8G5B9_9CELL|nr:hypothetical protein GCM10025865_26000 [Paraoerskovia sediminicola]
MDTRPGRGESTDAHAGTGTPTDAGTDTSSAGTAGTDGASGRGFGRVLVAVYGVFALAAGARAGYQLVEKFDEAPVAYLLSAFAALVYVVATVALARGRGRWRTVAWIAVGVELVGVVTVGVLSFADAAAFPDETVWSGFGAGYGYVPLVLPVVGLLWLRHTRPRSEGAGTSEASAPAEGASDPGAPASPSASAPPTSSSASTPPASPSHPTRPPQQPSPQSQTSPPKEPS